MMGLFRRRMMMAAKEQGAVEEELGYFTIIAEETPVEMYVIPPYCQDEEKGEYLQFSYSLNGGNWIECSDELSIIIPSNGNARFKSEDPGWGNITDPFSFLSTNPFWIDGTIMSLLYGDKFDGAFHLNRRFMHGVVSFTYDEFGTGNYVISGLVGIKNTRTLLPATVLVDQAYTNMFHQCRNLVNAPELPATELTSMCYDQMFCDCTSLTQAPVLPAATLVDYCYNNMFYFCTSLNYIKMLATDISATACLCNWVDGVASTGTFVKHPEATWSVSGNSGVPGGWTIKFDGEEEEAEEITFTVEGGNKYGFEDKTYTAIRGMTFGEFVNSEYNVDEWTLVYNEYKGAYIVIHHYGEALVDSGTSVIDSDVIIENGSYQWL